MKDKRQQIAIKRIKTKFDIKIKRNQMCEGMKLKKKINKKW